MSIGIGSLGYAPLARFAPSRVVAPTGPDADAHVAPLETDRLELSSTPPPEARKQVETAYARALELAAQNRELHFARDEKGAIFVQVRDLDGNVVRTIPNSEVFDILAGAEA
jgi:flagellar protein FlaG